MDKNLHKFHVVYEGERSYAATYVGETMRNFSVRTAKHNNPEHNSEPVRHLRDNPTHSFQWRILCSPQSLLKRRILKGLMIRKKSPSLNKQVYCYAAQLFPLGITWTHKSRTERTRQVVTPWRWLNSRKRLVFNFFMKLFSLYSYTLSG